MAAIDVGPGATNRGATFTSGNTNVDKANTADGTGTINTVELWFDTNATLVEVALFSASGNNLTTNGTATIGSVVADSKQTFAGLSMAVNVGNYIGAYWNTGTMEADSSGGSGTWWVTGDYIPCTSQAFTAAASNSMSIYGTGTTLGIIALGLTGWEFRKAYLSVGHRAALYAKSKMT